MKCFQLFLNLFRKKPIIVFIILLNFHLPALFSQSNAELSLRNINCIVDDGKLFYQESNEIKINNRKGEEYCTVSIPFSGKQEVQNLEAYLKDTNGKIIRKLKKSEIVKKSNISSISLYEDDYILQFTLKENFYPYYICYSYDLEFDNLISLVSEIPVLALDIPSKKVKVKLSHPVDYKIKVHQNDFLEYKCDTIEDIINHYWISVYSKNLDKELMAPPYSEYLPFLYVFPEEFHYDIPGNLSSWDTYGDWVKRLISGLTDLPVSEKNIILDLVKEETEDLQKMKILYEYLQDNTRYINVSIKTGGHKPFPASYVSENKYGDCKALSIYYKSMLKAIGISSCYTLIYAGDKINKISKDFPSPQFNHAIITVPMKKDTVWVDCTSDNPFLYTSTFIQNREAFVIDKDTCYFLKSPALKAEDVKKERIMYISLSVLQQASLKTRTIYKGEDYEAIDYYLKNCNKSDKDRILKEYILPKSCQIESWEVQDNSRDDRELIIESVAYSKSMVNKYGKELFVKIIPLSIPDFEMPEYRELPVQINFPVVESDSVIYQNIQTENYLNNLKNMEILTEFGCYRRKVEKGEKEIIISKSFQLYPGEIDLNKYADFYKFINKIRAEEYHSVLVIKQDI